MSEALLELKNVTKRFPLGGFLKSRFLTAVEDVSFEMPRNKPLITTLAGESGSGKSTMGKLVLGFLTPTYGEIKYKGKNIDEILKKERKVFRKEVQAVFQDPFASYNPLFKVDHVLKLTIKNYGLASSQNAAHKIIYTALESVGLLPDRILGKYAHQISGGEAQRIMVARALLTKPKLIIADEPVSMVDMSLRAGILNVFLNLKKERHMSILFITHDLSVAYYLSDNIIILNYGRIVEKGNAKKVISKPTHPYVKLLIDSVPSPNPKDRWKAKINLNVEREFERPEKGCVFQERCIHVTERCRETNPPMISIDKHHDVACYLYA